VADFEIVRHTPLSAAQAWTRLTHWERHSDFIPLTTIRLTGVIRGDVGATFVARTTLGPLHFDDPMELTKWQPPVDDEPGVCEITKRGSVVTGWAVLTVSADDDGATIRWQEDAGFRAAGNLLNWPNRLAGRRVFGKLVDGLLDDTHH
jgi:hypothetical protein